MRILALQPWDAGSHKAVRRSIERHSAHSWTWFCLPGKEVRWRLRLGAAQLMGEVLKTEVFKEGVDGVFCTGLLDVAQLRALLPKGYRDVPITLYMHENQLAYPKGPSVSVRDQERDGHLVATNISSVLAADRVIFNSEFNRQSFVSGLPGFLQDSKTRYPVDEWQERIVNQSSICWPPVEAIPESVLRNTGEVGYSDKALVAWPHRFEHDKGPDELMQVMEKASVENGLRFSLFGERFESIPAELKSIRERFGGSIECDRWFDHRPEYLEELARCGWVLSTARHEFFGIAVVEALMCGCLPWLPDRLSYPEILPTEAHGLSPMDPPKDPALIRELIQSHVRPALAPNAVSLLDRLLCAPPSKTP